jgi:hypothetical protein
MIIIMMQFHWQVPSLRVSGLPVSSHCRAGVNMTPRLPVTRFGAALPDRGGHARPFNNHDSDLGLGCRVRVTSTQPASAGR